MIPYFPKQIASRAILVYLASLTLVSVFFFRHAMSFWYMLLGLVFVVGFFVLTNVLSKDWKDIREGLYLRYIFILALVIRVIWVIASYYYYIDFTGIPFEYGTADALGYHDEAQWLASEDWSVTWQYYFGEGSTGISDVGYPLYLSVLYRIFGPDIMLPRIIKALLSSYMCILVYRIGQRTFGEKVGRMAGLMCVCMPNLIIYCGYHLKEVEMLFLEVAFLERMDFILRGKKIDFWSILQVTLLAASLFFFRTVLGIAAVLSAATGILISSTPSMKGGWRRTILILYGILCLVAVSGGTAMTEVEALWEQKDENLSKKRTEQVMRGSQWAVYATGTVMAPMVVVLPFSTMVNVEEQYAQQTKHGGNFIRNFMGFFAILAIIEAIRRKKMREYAMLGVFVLSYLGIVSVSGFSNSERFLLPGLPVLLLMWAYGISELRQKSFFALVPWCFLVIAMEFGWAFFKLGTRGLFY